MACQIATAAVVLISFSAYNLLPAETSQEPTYFVAQNTTLSNAFPPQPQSLWLDRPFLPNPPSVRSIPTSVASRISQAQCSWLDHLAVPHRVPSTCPLTAGVNHLVTPQSTCLWLDHLPALDIARAESTIRDISQTTYLTPVLTVVTAILLLVIMRAILRTRISMYKFCFAALGSISRPVAWVVSAIFMHLTQLSHWVTVAVSSTVEALMLWIGFVPNHKYYLALANLIAVKATSASLRRTQLHMDRANKREASKQAARISSLEGQLSASIARENHLADELEKAESNIGELSLDNSRVVRFGTDLFDYIIFLGKVADIAEARFKEHARSTTSTTSGLRDLLSKTISAMQYLTRKSRSQTAENEKLQAELAALKNDLAASKAELLESKHLLSTTSQAAHLDAERIKCLEATVISTSADLNNSSLKLKNSRCLAAADNMIKERALQECLDLRRTTTELRRENIYLRQIRDSLPAAQPCVSPVVRCTEAATQTAVAARNFSPLAGSKPTPKPIASHQRSRSLQLAPEELHPVTHTTKQVLKGFGTPNYSNALCLSRIEPEQGRPAGVSWGWNFGVINSTDAQAAAEQTEEVKVVEDKVLVDEYAETVFPSLANVHRVGAAETFQAQNNSVASASDVGLEPVEAKIEPSLSLTRASEPNALYQETVSDNDTSYTREKETTLSAATLSPALPMSPPLTPGNLSSAELERFTSSHSVPAAPETPPQTEESQAELPSTSEPTSSSSDQPPSLSVTDEQVSMRTSHQPSRRPHHGVYAQALGDVLQQKSSSAKARASRPTPSGAQSAPLSIPAKPSRGPSSSVTSMKAALSRRLYTGYLIP